MSRAESRISRDGPQTSVSVLKLLQKILLFSQDAEPLNQGYQWLIDRGARTGLRNNRWDFRRWRQIWKMVFQADKTLEGPDTCGNV